ncbi:MAG: Ig-like domain-containing protein, partial [Gammaproteobacteria bacterium]
MILILAGMLNTAAAATDVQVDIRATAPIAAGTDAAAYALTISDCTDLTSIDITAGDFQQSYSPADASRIDGSATGCELDFSGSGTGVFDPQAVLHFRDGTSLPYGEHFDADSNPPQLTFQNVSLQNLSGQQYLIVQAQASDDVDMSYVGFSVVGLRASDLRAAGGVVSKAEDSAFADSHGTVRVYSTSDDNSTFSLALPVTGSLTADQIAHDGVVLVDLTAVDASGNQQTYSTLAFTGNDVVEQASSLTTAPDSIVFNNLLQTATVVPTVDFQFRGPTALAGAGMGVTYTSSRPDLVSVTTEGVVYPLKATDGQVVNITVSYPGLSSVEIPVTVDLTRQLTSLQTDGLNANGQFVLDHLNGKVALPKIYAIFDDGSRTEISSQFTLNYSAGAGSSGILDVDNTGNVTAHTIIPSSTPIPVTVGLQTQPDIKVTIPVAAQDALPTVTLSAPTSVQVGDTITVSANASDDVAVHQVQFTMGGAPVGTVQKPPYQITLQTTDQLVNQNLAFQAVAVDSAGQASAPATVTVAVQPKTEKTVPATQFEMPVDNQRAVEGTPMRFSVSHKLDPGGESTHISYVDFFLDGTKVGSANFPRLEQRQDINADGSTSNDTYELWQFDTTVPHTSTDETSLAVYAEVHADNGGSAQTPSRLIRVIKDTAPSIQITSPATGKTVSVGQSVTANLQFSDDTLPVGADITLMLNGNSVGQFHYSDPNNQYVDATAAQSATHSFTIPVTADELGTTLRLQAQIIDFGQQVSLSNLVKLPVQTDQPPSVALSYPTPGTQLVSCQTIELRANAADDVGVTRVDFYVDGHLVGSDSSSPYSVDYQSAASISTEQTLTLKAAAFDTAGQQTDSVPVQVTLGKDETAPVVNIVSPPVTGTDAGKDLTQVVEDSLITLKATGYDNVGVTKLELRGVKKSGTDYVLTGDMNDVLSSDDFPPQQVPGAVHAFSAFKLVKVPLYSHAANTQYDQYPVQITATDGTGNASTSKVIVTVVGDQDPVIAGAKTDRDSYFSRDKVLLDVQAHDDRAVSSLNAAIYVDGGASPAVTHTLDSSSGLVPGATVEGTFDIDLASLNLSNATHTLRVVLKATDDRGHKSSDHAAAYEIQVPIQTDTNKPLLGILQPTQSTTLYQGHQVTIQWRASDDSSLASVHFLLNGTTVNSQNVSGATATGSFTLTVPSGSSQLQLEAHAVDIYGNEGVSTWQYAVTTDTPPQVTIRAPAAGSQMVEGESFTMSAYVSDDNKVNSATFFVAQGGTDIFDKTFSASDIATAIAAAAPLSAGMRVPHNPGAGQSPVIIGVRATDDSGQTSQALLQIQILDDKEPPHIQMTAPAQALSVMPGDSFQVTGTADDNVYVDTLVPVLVAPDGTETTLSWQVLSRKDHVENITVPNLVSFGSSIVAQRY